MSWIDTLNTGSTSIALINPVSYHFEIVLSLLCLFSNVTLFSLYHVSPLSEDRFQMLNYVQSTRNISVTLKDYDENNVYTETFLIYVTMYPADKKFIKEKSQSNTYFIVHSPRPPLKAPHVVYLTDQTTEKLVWHPSCMPFPAALPPRAGQKNPVFVVQGNVHEKRRNYKSLLPILKANFGRNFTIRIIGRGRLPHYLEKFLGKNLEFIQNAGEMQFFSMISESSGILPLIDSTFKHEYTTGKFSSSILYARSYRMIVVGHESLQQKYKGIPVFYPYLHVDSTGPNSFFSAFQQALMELP